MNKENRIQGFTLLEVMIALLVLSVGLLALASVQILSVRNSNNSYYRTQATVMANDMVERMRANRDGLEAGDYDGLTPDCTVMPVQYCARYDGTAAQACSPAQLATYDAFVVACGMRRDATSSLGGLNDLLSGSNLTITCQPAVSATCSATVGWTEVDETGTQIPGDVTVTFVP